MTPKQLEIFAMVYGFHELTEEERAQVHVFRMARVERGRRSREAAKKRRALKKGRAS